MSISNIRLIATDMDGTLLNSNHEVNDSFGLFSGNLKTRESFLLQLAEGNITIC